MSSSKQLIINCGASNVTAALISYAGGSLHLDKLVTEELRYDYTNDDAWLSAVGDALASLSKQHKLSGKATFILSGSQLLTKTIRIPHVEKAKQAQIIAFEAQQSIPYPLHEVVWDSQIVDDDGVETEVLFLACKSEIINDFCRSVKAAGLVVEKISAATLLDRNALQLSYPELSDDVLLINLGARSTNLLFQNSDGFFVRNIPIGGNSLTQSIADSLGKSFSQAEVIKCKFFGGETSFSDDDAGAKQLLTSSESFMRRMSQEITRSIVNYRRQKNAPAPKRILLSGRGALLKGLSSHLSTAQKMPVELFDPLKNVTLDGAVDGNMNVVRHLCSEIIGEACVGMTTEGAGVNLLPEDVKAEMKFSRQKPILLAAAACLALAPWPAFLGIQMAVASHNEYAQTLRSEIAPLQARSNTIYENTEKAEAVGTAIQRVEGLVNSKTNWIQFFAELQRSLNTAEDVWIDALKVIREQPEDGEASYELEVEGKMLVRQDTNNSEGIDQDALYVEISSLQSSFESSQFVVSSKPPRIDWTSLRRDGLNLLPFSINLVVDTAKPL